MLSSEAQYKSIIRKVRSVESKLIPIKTHLRGLTDYFREKEPYENLKSANWFWVASSINSVDFDGIMYDCAFYMCSPAFEYEEAKQRLYTKLIDEVTRFLYVYSGFEALVNELELSNCPSKKGKVNSASNFIKDSYSKDFNSIPYYNELLRLLRILIQNSALQQFERKFTLDECTDLNGLALKIVYVIRNKLLHGDFDFPEPSEWSLRLPLEPEISQISSRLILITIQMILIAQNASNFDNLVFHDSEILQNDEDGYSEIHELEYLQNLHILQKPKRSSQLELFKS